MRDKIKIFQGKLKYFRILLQKIPKEKRLLGIGVVVLVGLLLYESLLAVQLQRLKAIDFQFVSQKKLLDFYCQLVENVDNLINETREKELNFIQIKKKFISEEDLPDFFANFRQQIKAGGLQIVSLDFKPQEEIKGQDTSVLASYRRLPFEFSLKGKYFEAMLFLHKIEQSSPLFQIKSLLIKQETAESAVVILDLKVAVYILTKKD